MKDFRYKAVVFDLGGTLMEYEGMPLDWSEFYYRGFLESAKKNHIKIYDDKIKSSAEIMRSYNPRLTGREVEISSDEIFCDAVSDWNYGGDITDIIKGFWDGLELSSRVFEYTDELIVFCRQNNAKIACLTDLPNGMPDRIFKPAIRDVESKLDLYMSSEICGYRKPNKAGIQKIAEYFQIRVDEILLVGDEEKDLKTSENAGCDFMFINEFTKMALSGN